MRAAWLAAMALCACVPLRAQTRDVELRALIHGTAARRNAALDAVNVAGTSGTMVGGEVGLRAAWLGATVRVLGGDLDATGGANKGTVASGEVYVEGGPPMGAVTLGLGRRAVAGPLGTTVYSYMTVGAASVLDIGGTGVSARVAARVYVTGSGPGGASVGGQAVFTALEYALHGSPLLITLGYRGEVFTVKAGSERSENLSGVVVGCGVRF